MISIGAVVSEKIKMLNDNPERQLTAKPHLTF
jgi:hypothetical protein